MNKIIKTTVTENGVRITLENSTEFDIISIENGVLQINASFINYNAALDVTQVAANQVVIEYKNASKR